MLRPEQILYEDNHLLVINKPAGVVTQGASSDQTSLGHQAKHYLKTKYHKPGNVFLGFVSRLDKLTTGVILLARTSKAAARLTWVEEISVPHNRSVIAATLRVETP